MNQYQVSIAVTNLSGVITNGNKDLGADHPGACYCGNPISIGNGNKYEHVEDYRTRGANPLAFERFYNSLGSTASIATTLGTKWRSNYDRYLRIASPTSITAERADGQEVNFSLSGGKWTSDSDIDLTLTQTGILWTLTDSNDNLESYTTIGATEAVLQSIKTRNGYKQTLLHNPDQTLASVSDSYGRSLIFAYQSGLLKTVTTPENTLTFGYAAQGSQNLLASVSYWTTPATTVTYIYDDPSLPTFLTGIKDENGNRFATWTYDNQGRALSSQHADGAELTRVTYNDTDNSRTVTNALGVADTYSFSIMQGVPKVTRIGRAATPTTAAATQTFSYDNNGYLSGKTDWNNNTTAYTNDAHGQPLIITEGYGSPVARTTTVTYDQTWSHLPSTIVTPGLTTTLKYDGFGNLQNKTLTDTSATAIPYPTAGTARTWIYGWTNYLLTSITGPRTDLSAVTKFGYDTAGALTSITNALGQQTTIKEHTPGGRPMTVTDPNGVTTQLTYDGRQRLKSKAVTTAAGVLTTSLVYDPAGNLSSITQPDGSTLTNTHDPAHRLTRVTDSLGNYVNYTLDALDDRTQTSIYKADGTQTWQRRGTFDALGRLHIATAGAGQTATQNFDPNGNVSSIIDGRGNTTINTYDALNRPGTSTDANAGVTKTGFDAHDRVVSVTDANGNTTYYTRNGFGDVIQRVSPDSGTAIFYVDSDGNVTSKKDALGIVTNQTFDALNRPSARTYPSSPAENVRFTYDEDAGVFGVGWLTSLTDQAGTLTRRYDELGNLTREQRVNGVNTLTTIYGYDKASRIAAVTYPDGTLVSYQHDAAGYLSNAAAKLSGAAAATQLASFTHQPFGPTGSLTYGNGVTEAWTFDQSYRPSNIADVLSGANLQNLSYGYDLADNVTSIADAVNAANNQTIGYDQLDRLNSAVSGPGGYGSLGWQYDNVGNRLTQTQNGLTTTYTYTPGTNRLATISPVPIIAAHNTAPDLGGHGSLPVQKMFGNVLPSSVGSTMSTGPPSLISETSRPVASEQPPAPQPSGNFRSDIPRRNIAAIHTASFMPASYIVHGNTTNPSSSANALNIFNASGMAAQIRPTPPPSPALPPSGMVYAPFLFSIPVDPYTKVFYTENGTTPTTGSYLYQGPFWVGSSLLIRAIAASTLIGGGTSSIASAQYVFATATPNFSLAGGTYNSYQTLTITDATPGAMIFYTVDGTTPTTNSPRYTGPLQIQQTEIVDAVAFANNVASGRASAQYTILLPPAAAPVFSPPAGNYTSSQTVTVSDATPGTSVYFTVDGTTPTAASSRYTSPISVGATGTLQAIAVAAGLSNSGVASATYNISLPTLPAPRFAPVLALARSYATVAIVMPAPVGFPPAIPMLFYTTDGSAPTTSSLKYTSPFAVSSSTTINAIAAATGYTNSPVSTETIQFSILPAPLITPASGAYNTSQKVTLTDTQPTSQIFYTLDGSTPTSDSVRYTSPIAVTGSVTVKALAVAKFSLGFSPVASANYTISTSVATVTTNANGNIASIPPANGTANATFSYNNANRLQAVTGSPTAASFLYDAFGQRYSKTDGGTPPTIYSYAQGGTLIAENDNGVVTDYIYADGRPIAQIQPGATPAANQVSYVLADPLSTPQRLVDGSGAAVWSTTYQPFGPTGTINATVNQNLRFPGQLADAETGFSYNHFRDYMPNFGRYLEADPIGLRGGLNIYAYAKNNPILFADPTGTDVRVYLTTNVQHEVISVDTSQGPVGIGFGPQSFWGVLIGRGEIDTNTSGYGGIPPKSSLLEDIPLSLSAGDQLVSDIKMLAQNPPPYSVLAFNCQQFVCNVIGSLPGESAAGCWKPIYLPHGQSSPKKAPEAP